MTQFWTLAMSPRLFLVVLKMGPVIFSEFVAAGDVGYMLQQFYFASTFSEAY